MGRVMAIDYGQKRVGIAVSDLLHISANGLTTLSVNEVFPFLEKYLVQENVESIVVGFPRQMNGKESESMKYIRPFVTKLSLKFPQIELIYEDERFTSVLAHKTMLEGGLKKKDRQNKALVDKISATIILQSYLESVRYKNNRNT
ncbi:Holliday junction resolvase RuvX [Porphyromonadaceae sp. NP-X]|jgi:putative Holliday junction resolvase|nr:Holliday junction resolvase RuvX [Paludibacteraceae bacterium]MDS1031977.1 Holliday junction resolvase RuvX [Porphyromonadaceae sp. NP-X]HNZ61498.1 Holliday junction resolvase RuvX [Paludibacteraceae bacterium]